MKKKLLRSALVLLLLTAAGCHAADFTGKVIKVDDGDTVWLLPAAKTQFPKSVTVKDGAIKIRLWIADAPEIHHNSKECDQPGGQEARKYTAKLAEGKQVTVHTHNYSYDRVVGEVILPDGTSLNRGLLKYGHAQADLRYRPPKEYLADQAEAEGAKRGIWKETNPISPWDWRHQGLAKKKQT